MKRSIHADRTGCEGGEGHGPIPEPCGDDVEFLTCYRQLRCRHSALHLSHHPDALAAAARLLRSYDRITFERVLALLGGHVLPARAAQAHICAVLERSYRPPMQLKRVEPEACQTMLNTLRSELGDWPMTALDEAFNPLLPDLKPTYCQRLLNMRAPLLRHTAMIGYLLAHAQHLSENQQVCEIKAWEMFEAWCHSDERHAPDVDIHNPDGLQRQLHDWLAIDPTRRVIEWWRLIAIASARIKNYLADKPELADAVKGQWLLIAPISHDRLAKRVWRECKAAAQARRSARADPIADHYGEIIDLVDQRFAEIALIRDAYDAICAELEATGAGQSRYFAVELPARAPGGAPPQGMVRLNFHLMSAALLDRFIHYRPPCRGTRTAWQDVRYHLNYLGADYDGTPAPGPAVLNAYAMGAFVETSARTAAQEAQFATWRAEQAWDQGLASLAPFRYASTADRYRANQAFLQGMVLVPISALHHGLALGRAIARCGLMTGARIFETLQAVYPDSFGYERRSDALHYYFLARPKMHVAQERFFLDETTLMAISDVVRTAQRAGYPLSVVPSRARQKGPAARYVFQARSCALDHVAANCCLRVALIGHAVSNHDIRHAFSRFSFGTGSGLARVSAALHHRHEGVTRLYTPVSDGRKMQLARTLAERLASGDAGGSS